MKKTSTEITGPFPRSDLSIKVGSIKGKLLIADVRLSDCRGPNCPIHAMCTHTQKGKCKYEKDYLESYYLPLVDPEDGIGDRLSARDLDALGRYILPLMQRLVKLQIDIKAIDLLKGKPFSMSYSDSKGRLHMFPQMRAADECLKAIGLWEERLKISQKWEKKHGTKDLPLPGEGSGVMESSFLEGMEGSYEEMANIETLKPEPECPGEAEEAMPSEYDMLYEHLMNTTPAEEEYDGKPESSDVDRQPGEGPGDPDNG